MLDDITTLRELITRKADRRNEFEKTVDVENGIANVEAYLSVTDWFAGMTVDSAISVNTALDIIGLACMGDDLFGEW